MSVLHQQMCEKNISLCIPLYGAQSMYSHMGLAITKNPYQKPQFANSLTGFFKFTILADIAKVCMSLLSLLLYSHKGKIGKVLKD